jgi:type IV pilus assembly protein PilB
VFWHFYVVPYPHDATRYSAELRGPLQLLWTASELPTNQHDSNGADKQLSVFRAGRDNTKSPDHLILLTQVSVRFMLFNANDSELRDAAHYLKRWGFTRDCPPALKTHAENCAQLGHLPMGDIVAGLGLVTPVQLEDAFQTKPANVLSLEHLVRVFPPLQEHFLRILAVSRSLPFLATIDSAWVEGGADLPNAARARLDELNAAYVVAPGGNALVVFSDLNSLLQFSQAGRLQKSEDPIRSAVPSTLEVALAPPTVVTRASRNEGSTDASRVVSSAVQDSFWAPSMAKTDAERVLARLLDEAISRKATDVSIAPLRDGTSEVRFRIYGDITTPERNTVLSPAQSKEITNFLISRSRAGDGGRLRKAADGQLTYKNTTSEVFVRASFIPADRFGLDFDMVSSSLRLLPRTSRSISLAELRLHRNVNQEVRKALMRSQGLIVVAGPTNSGKSTTIAGVVGEHLKMFGITKKRLSLEDPVERYLDGITQISVENNFAELIRAMLRHDPDLIWVGEIRDSFSAGACVRAATSGHVVLSTVHANNSILAFRAVSNYLRKDTGEASGGGASLFDLAEAISVLVGQRLVKKLCPKCRKPHTLTAQDFELAEAYLKSEGQGELWPKTKTVLSRGLYKANPVGCAACMGTGYAGEMPINEVLPVTREVRELLSQTETRMDMKALSGHRLNTLAESALELIEKGETEFSALFI